MRGPVLLGLLGLQKMHKKQAWTNYRYVRYVPYSYIHSFSQQVDVLEHEQIDTWLHDRREDISVILAEPLGYTKFQAKKSGTYGINRAEWLLYRADVRTGTNTPTFCWYPK